ncbi:VOC family protein [Acuticoccus sp. MNP-M23]|uniref:VOC family protein n=1 Tax=Acuticoccus sp. MNP-M23 TaxID=3072793 RepID=UPI002815FE91|nr:VOC family protein [Acuticoccus sp. MNP-M23]WMS44359.1 VOC family protein [Acuticoccus sp. MNP-M23]
MTHKSRIGCIVIDCKIDELSPALAFWSAALGCDGKIDERGKYAILENDRGDPRILLQAVDHDPRVHLDIETDDKEAEAARLAALGATRVEEFPRWIIMEAPTGHRFCLIGPTRDGFEEHAPAVG